MSMANIPHDPETERELLATIGAPGADQIASMTVPKLCEEDFFVTQNRLIFLAIVAVVRRREELNFITIKAALERAGDLERAGNYQGVVDLLSCFGVGNPDSLVERLQDLRRARRLLHLGGKLVAQAQDAMLEPMDVVSEALGDLKSIAEAGRVERSESGACLLDDLASLEPLRSSRADRAGMWGIPFLDREAPIPAGEFAVIGARPGTGKSMLMVQSACASAAAGFRTLILTMELPAKDLKARIAAHLSGAALRDLKAGRYDASVANACAESGALQNLRWLSPATGTPWNHLEAMIRYEVEHHGIEVVYLDQFDKIGRPAVGRGSSEAYSFGKVSEGIMAMTKELTIGFVLLCQLKGDADGREPELKDHADSDRPGKDGSVVVHLWKNAKGETRAKVQKNRNGGWVGKVIHLDVDGSKQRLREKEGETDAPSGPVPTDTYAGPGYQSAFGYAATI